MPVQLPTDLLRSNLDLRIKPAVGAGLELDLPTDQNGTNTGPTALELCVMSLAGCITTLFKTVAGKHNFIYKAFRVELEAEKPKDALTVTGLKGKMESNSNGL